MSYVWKHTLDERGYKEVPHIDYTLGQNKKYDYVEQYLSPCIEHSNCGWDHCIFYVLENQYGKAEYIALYSGKSARWINVTGNSLGAIAEATWMNVFN